MNQSSSYSTRSSDLVMTAVVASLYVVLTMVLAPLSFGIGVRISEGLNFLALYNKRHIYGITLGVFISNYFAFGVWDMIVGSLSSLVFLFICRWLGDWLVERVQRTGRLRMDPMILRYIVLTVVFSWSMFTIAILVKFLDPSASFWPLYGMMAFTEGLSLVFGGLVMYPLSKRIDFTR